MTLYIVSFDTRYHVDTVESSQLKRLGTAHANKLDDRYTLYKPGAGHYGYIWQLSQIFTIKEAAHAYINKDYNTAYKNQWEGEKDV